MHPQGQIGSLRVTKAPQGAALTNDEPEPADEADEPEAMESGYASEAESEWAQLTLARLRGGKAWLSEAGWMRFLAARNEEGL